MFHDDFTCVLSLLGIQQATASFSEDLFSEKCTKGEKEGARHLHDCEFTSSVRPNKEIVLIDARACLQSSKEINGKTAFVSDA